ncbi:MAG: cysteine desulfurase family protein [Minisyncoccia bacterium]
MKYLEKFFKKKRIFLDYASTTPVALEVSVAMKQAQKIYANPSALYTEANFAKEKINESKKIISEILDCQKDNLIFTSGGTEGNNIALLGVFEKYKTYEFTPHFVVTKIEHPSVLEVCEEIKRRGGEVSFVNVSENGIAKVADIEKEIKENTVLVSVMYANNEIGTIQPIKEIGRMIREKKRESGKNLPYFHTDACQAGLYLSLNTHKLNVDLMTLDGIKIYGPRGAGILFVRHGVEIHPIFFGGGQESGRRSGTENLSAVIGLAKCLELAEKYKEKESERLKEIRDYGISQILENFPKASLNGDVEKRLPNNINICFPGIDAEFVTISLDVHGFCVSYSSSCRTLKEDSSSYVLDAIGKQNCNLSSLRFTLGRESRKGDIDRLIDALKQVIK